MSQSTNDSYTTALRGVILRNDKLVGELNQLVASFRAKGDAYLEIVKMGRTEMQDAVPMTVGQELHAFAASLEDEITGLKDAEKALYTVNMGATAIGTGINVPAGYADRCVPSCRSRQNYVPSPRQCLRDRGPKRIRRTPCAKKFCDQTIKDFWRSDCWRPDLEWTSEIDLPALQMVRRSGPEKLIGVRRSESGRVWVIGQRRRDESCRTFGTNQLNVRADEGRCIMESHTALKSRNYFETKWVDGNHSQ